MILFPKCYQTWVYCCVPTVPVRYVVRKEVVVEETNRNSFKGGKG